MNQKAVIYCRVSAPTSAFVICSSQELFLIAKEMFEELWEYRRQNSQNEALSAQKELQDIERKVGQLLDRVVDASSQTLVTAYEGRIKELEAQKISLSEKIKNCGRPLQSFDETFRTAFQFLGNPHKIWVSGGIEDKRIVLKLAFAEKLSYQRNGGFRTAATALPFRVLGDLQRGNKEMVEGSGLESNFLDRLVEASKWFNYLLEHANSDWRGYRIATAKRRAKAA